MAEVQLKGVYGSSLTVDDEGVTFQAKGRMSKGALGSDERRVPFDAITDRSFKPANIATNGHIELVTANGKSIFHFMTGKAARAAADAFELIVERTPDAGDETASRGLTTKQGAEGATLKETVAALRELQASMKADMSNLREAMRDERLSTLFPGLTFDADNVTYRGVTQPIAGASAVVDTAGALDRRPTLSRVAVGGILFGALGAVGGGLLQKKVDTRQVFVLIDGPQAAWAVPAKADQFGDATQFAALFNTAAKTAVKAAAAAEGVAEAEIALGEGTAAGVETSSGVAERLASLASLHAQGILSDQEFTDAKSAVLAGH